ncbi:MAG: pilus (MSHA type) biogenesis protein MshL [Campylobacteraceae bacterium 4484_4]|nr:MAG: pilus (MSHA type) biogenesis protein MshL [Campylobacteraceae bacterium 4484_4]
MQKSVSNKIKISLLSLGVLFWLSQMTLFASSCDVRTFNIKIADKVQTSEILNQLSNECGFSIITKDPEAKKQLDEEVYGINIKKMTLDEIFDILVKSKGLEYSYDKNVLMISGLTTKTFHIDYVNTEREGTSSTDITLTGDTSTEDGDASKGGSLSTGANIKSTDSFSFWGKIEKELTALLNAPSDTFKAAPPIINREAGLITVSGTTAQVARIESYLEQLMDRLHKQVMIDVKILSVSLDGSRQTGINWGEIYKLQNVKVGYEGIDAKDVSKYEDSTITEIVKNGIFHSRLLKLTGSTGITDLLKFLQTQGKVSAISNPKVVTLSNQPAVFSSGDQLYYKLSSSSRQTGANAATETYNNEVVKSVFAGILLDITPEITDEGDIILKINPSISSVKSDVKSDTSAVRKLPPDLMKKQISSVVKLHDGEKIVLGGLINTREGTETSKVPVLGNIPVLGYAFKQKKKTLVREELVIVITPHIIHSGKEKRAALTLKDLGYKDIK